MKKLKLQLLEDKFTISKLPVFDDLPHIIAQGEMCFTMRTDEEFTVITPEFMAPNNVQQEIGWRAIRVDGGIPFQASGVLESMLRPLADADIPIFAASTFNTDYVFFPEDQMVNAVKALQQAGHQFVHKE
ncbi:MAG: ACT domain-containing protein [Ignavibacteriales bacterium]|nr:ACT domain-containing protein [Ignavibacteriales bacterium]